MNHLHINVPDVSEAKRFYERYFDFKQVYPDSQRLFMKDPSGFLLALDPLPPGTEAQLPDWFHFGLCRTDPAWARELYKRMKSDGVPIVTELQEFESAAVFFCWAPGPYRVEVRGNKAD